MSQFFWLIPPRDGVESLLPLPAKNKRTMEPDGKTWRKCTHTDPSRGAVEGIFCHVLLASHQRRPLEKALHSIPVFRWNAIHKLEKPSGSVKCALWPVLVSLRATRMDTTLPPSPPRQRPRGCHDGSRGTCQCKRYVMVMNETL